MPPNPHNAYRMPAEHQEEVVDVVKVTAPVWTKGAVDVSEAGYTVRTVEAVELTRATG